METDRNDCCRYVRLDRATRGLICILTGLLAVIVVELWVGLPSSVPSAIAQIPDTALQRENILDEAKKTNRLLEKILDHLKSGTVKVKSESADKRGGKKEKDE